MRLPVVGECGPTKTFLNTTLQIPPPRLLHLDRFEQGLEIALPEPSASLPLDDLEKHGRTILDWLRKDLQQVAFFVAVYEYTKLAQLRNGLLKRPDAVGQN